jgi:hypothetical protein
VGDAHGVRQDGGVDVQIGQGVNAPHQRNKAPSCAQRVSVRS